MERQHSLIVSEEKRRRKNERSRAKRASETESEKRQRCDKRNAADRARRTLKLKIEQQSSTKRQVTEENVATNFQKRQRLDTESDTDLTLIMETEMERTSRLQHMSDLQQQRISAETHEERISRLQHISDLQQQRTTKETPEERASRLQHMSDLQQWRTAEETPDKRTSRLQHMSDLQQQQIAAETDEERASRLQHMSDLQQQRISTETHEERATRISAAQERLQNRTLDDEKLPKLEQRGVQAKMQSFHRDIAALSSPTCITCMESFPGMRVTSKSECARCSRDKHTPKVFSEANNMNPGQVPPELQVSK